MTALSLKKDQSLSLVKDNGSALTRVRLGLGWDAIKRGFFGRAREIDLDASAILIGDGRVRDIVFFNHETSNDGSIHHTGDNLTGAGDGDDEQIIIDLTRVNPAVDKIVLVITSFSGQTFNEIENVFARVVDLSDGPEKEVVRYDLADGGTQTGNVIAKLTRDGDGWKFTALGLAGTGKVAHDLQTAALNA